VKGQRVDYKKNVRVEMRVDEVSLQYMILSRHTVLFYRLLLLFIFNFHETNNRNVEIRF